MLAKTFFQAHIKSHIDYASTLWDSSSESLLKPIKSLHRRAVKIILLKNTINITNDDYKKTKILPLKHRLMYNKARFMHKILSGKAPIYLVKRVSINLYSRNYSRKLNVPMPRLDLFKVKPKVLWTDFLEFTTCCTYRIKYIVSLQTSTVGTYAVFPRYNLG